jgi:bifunctional UDP-N-acetylglucosamine pyrophosphorylase/glucosamine-1-phosphate N-acetyltransferase
VEAGSTTVTPEQRAITECNSGVMCFDGGWLWEALARVQRNPLKGEYYLTDTVALAVEDQGLGAVLAEVAADPREAWGVNDRAQLAQAETAMRERLLDAIMRSGVTVVDPASTYIDVDVTVGRDSTLHPGTMLRGATVVGARCHVGPHTTLIDTQLGDGARVRYTLAEGAVIPPGADIGPFTHIK